MMTARDWAFEARAMKAVDALRAGLIKTLPPDIARAYGAEVTAACEQEWARFDGHSMLVELLQRVTEIEGLLKSPGERRRRRRPFER